MSRQKLSLRVLSALAAIGSLGGWVGGPPPSWAQGLPGLTIFSGVARENQLSWRMDFDGEPGGIDRYRLRIPAKKMQFAVEQFSVTYPDTYKGEFDTKEIEVRVNGKKVPLSDATWDAENRVVEIYPQTPVPANSRVELVLSQVRNPNRIGTHYFNAMVRSPGDLPLMRYVGTWILTIGPR